MSWNTRNGVVKGPLVVFRHVLGDFPQLGLVHGRARAGLEGRGEGERRGDGQEGGEELGDHFDLGLRGCWYGGFRVRLETEQVMVMFQLLGEGERPILYMAIVPKH